MHLSEQAIPHVQLSLTLPSLSRLWPSACSGTVIIAWQDRVLSRCHCSFFRSCGSYNPAGRPHRGQPNPFKILTTPPPPAGFSFPRMQQSNLCRSVPASGSTSLTPWAENLTPRQASCHLPTPPPAFPASAHQLLHLFSTPLKDSAPADTFLLCLNYFFVGTRSLHQHLSLPFILLAHTCHSPLPLFRNAR